MNKFSSIFLFLLHHFLAFQDSYTANFPWYMIYRSSFQTIFFFSLRISHPLYLLILDFPYSFWCSDLSYNQLEKLPSGAFFHCPYIYELWVNVCFACYRVINHLLTLTNSTRVIFVKITLYFMAISQKDWFKPNWVISLAKNRYWPRFKFFHLER